MIKNIATELAKHKNILQRQHIIREYELARNEPKIKSTYSSEKETDESILTPKNDSAVSATLQFQQFEYNDPLITKKFTGNLNKEYYNSSNEFNMRINPDPEKIENGSRI